jgi:hypothetical protein
VVEVEAEAEKFESSGAPASEDPLTLKIGSLTRTVSQSVQYHSSLFTDNLSRSVC